MCRDPGTEHTDIEQLKILLHLAGSNEHFFQGTGATRRVGGGGKLHRSKYCSRVTGKVSF